MKKVISIILILFLFVPHIALADEINPDQTGKIIIGISKNLGLKSNVVDVNICQLKESSTLPPEVEPEPVPEPVPEPEPTEPTDPTDDPVDPDNPTDDTEEPTEPTNPDEPSDDEEEEEESDDDLVEPDGPFRFKRQFRGLLRIEDTNDLAYWEAIQKYIEDRNIECDSYQTDRNGKLILENMPIGYYFIYIPKFRVDDTIYVEQPVGVYLPGMNEEGNYEYEIVIYPKIDEEKTAKENYRPPEKEVPETGTNKYLIPIFLISGLLFIVIGRILIYEKKDR